MPGTVRVTVLEVDELPGPAEAAYSVKVSVGDRSSLSPSAFSSSSGEGVSAIESFNADFAFAVLNLVDPIIFSLLDANGQLLGSASLPVPAVVEKGFRDEFLNLSSGGRIHVKSSFVLSEAERAKIAAMRANSLRKKSPTVETTAFVGSRSTVAAITSATPPTNDASPSNSGPPTNAAPISTATSAVSAAPATNSGGDDGAAPEDSSAPLLEPPLEAETATAAEGPKSAPSEALSTPAEETKQVHEGGMEEEAAEAMQEEQDGAEEEEIEMERGKAEEPELKAQAAKEDSVQQATDKGKLEAGVEDEVKGVSNDVVSLAETEASERDTVDEARARQTGKDQDRPLAAASTATVSAAAATAAGAVTSETAAIAAAGAAAAAAAPPVPTATCASSGQVRGDAKAALESEEVNGHCQEHGSMTHAVSSHGLHDGDQKAEDEDEPASSLAKDGGVLSSTAASATDTVDAADNGADAGASEDTDEGQQQIAGAGKDHENSPSRPPLLSGMMKRILGFGALAAAMAVLWPKEEKLSRFKVSRDDDGRVHVVRPGDVLSELVPREQYCNPSSKFFQMNPDVCNVDLIYEGQRLRLP